MKSTKNVRASTEIESSCKETVDDNGYHGLRAESAARRVRQTQTHGHTNCELASTSDLWTLNRTELTARDLLPTRLIPPATQSTVIPGCSHRRSCWLRTRTRLLQSPGRSQNTTLPRTLSVSSARHRCQRTPCHLGYRPNTDDSCLQANLLRTTNAARTCPFE